MGTKVQEQQIAIAIIADRRLIGKVLPVHHGMWIKFNI